ncbi:DUF2000 domain-containing protein [Cronobacter turicensis]|uniref:DUF2000 domain-containing protein n=1 Tax=Cronobacter turicensis TaxID=413502 RepID=UPI0024C42803|nr:DUF2000 domain-containing protein [Cronobacter turicensis]ELY5848669.1 DUF2000 domain-containing protein [Cronobacter turicensis]MDK1333929.1 DUF2000 domain-containing protein [Cronobacter turicensis]
MQFDTSLHKCTIVVDRALTPGLAMNAASVLGVCLGRQVEGLVGPDLLSLDGVTYPGVIRAPLPVLLGEGNTLLGLFSAAQNDPQILVLPFSALAQSCKTWEEYELRLAGASSAETELAALGLVGPKKHIARLTGNLPLYR